MKGFSGFPQGGLFWCRTGGRSTTCHHSEWGTWTCGPTVDINLATNRKYFTEPCLSNCGMCIWVCTAKWSVLLSSIQLGVENTIKGVLACCELHNFNKKLENLWTCTTKCYAPVLMLWIFQIDLLISSCHQRIECLGKINMCLNAPWLQLFLNFLYCPHA